MNVDYRDAVAVVEFRITSADMDAFRILSGDTNPVHDDSEYPRRRGFAGALVYGGLLVAQISRLLGTRIPGPGCVERAITLRYRSPLYVDEPARLIAEIIHENDDLGVVDLKLRIEAGTRCIAEGEAAAMLARERSRARA
jgi:3-hydroxybutyryl-CoA dehydratase